MVLSLNVVEPYAKPAFERGKVLKTLHMPWFIQGFFMSPEAGDDLAGQCIGTEGSDHTKHGDAAVEKFGLDVVGSLFRHDD